MTKHPRPQRLATVFPWRVALLAVAVAALICAPPPLSAQAKEASAPVPLQGKADELIGLHAGRFADSAGLCAVDLRSGKLLLSHNPDKKLLPASNQKLLTSAAAVARLGSDFRFVTAVYRVGEDLLIAGTGDPLLGDPHLAGQAERSIYADLDAWAAKVKKTLPDGVAGDLLLLQKRRASRFRHPTWPKDQHQRWYCAPVASLNFHNNCLDITFPKGSDGRPTPAVSPASRYITIRDRTRRGKRQAWYALLDDHAGTVTLRGRVAKTSSHAIPVAVDHPPMLLGRVFADRLARAGVKVGGSLRSVGGNDAFSEKAVLIARTATPLTDVLARANGRSLNMAAEAMFLRAGDLSWAGSAKITTRVLHKSFGVDPNAVEIADGSGMSRSNRVSAAAMVQLLRAIPRHRHGKAVLNSLPRTGQKDTSLHDRLTRRPYAGRAGAKTGTLSGVYCLSGYVLDAEGKPAVAFSVLANRASKGPAEQLADRVVVSIVDWVDGR
ncbi:MAG: D-alanyl-D-alanine carboxypeptidase/D-alanyl-D-alanine-endopeptidase [Phycisphaerae bacterium]